MKTKIKAKDYNWQKKVEDKMGSEAPNQQDDLEPGTMSENPGKIVQELKRKSEDFSHAMSRLQFYINRNGKNLDSSDLRRLEQAKQALYRIYGEKPPKKKPIGSSTVNGIYKGIGMNLHSIFGLATRLEASKDTKLKQIKQDIDKSGLDLNLRYNPEKDKLYCPTVNSNDVKTIAGILAEIGYKLRMDKGVTNKSSYALTGNGLVLRVWGGAMTIYLED